MKKILAKDDLINGLREIDALLYEVCGACENLNGEFILKLKFQLSQIKKTTLNRKYINFMSKLVEEALKDVEKYNKYLSAKQTLKEQFIKDGRDEYAAEVEADEIAFDAAYS